MTKDELNWLAAEFDRCTGWLQAALDRDIGTHDIADVWSDIERGAVQFWPLRNSAIVTLIEEYPKLKLLRFWLAGGKLKELLENEPTIAEWGKARGCSVSSFIGRRGFVRTLTGYDESYVVGTRRL